MRIQHTKVTPATVKSKIPWCPFKQQGPSASQTHGALACFWCGRTPHAARHDCPAADDTCHRCGKRGHWQQVCQASTANAVTRAVNTVLEASTAHVTTHDVAQVQSASRGIFVDLDLSPSLSSGSAHCVCFQVDSGCSCNTIHVTDLKKMAEVKVTPSSVRLLDYSKTIIATGGQATLHCTHQGKPYDVVVQVITAENYYVPFLCLADSTRMGILNYDVDTVNQLQASYTASLPPLGELKFESIKHNYSHLFEGLGELGDPLSLWIPPSNPPSCSTPLR